LQTILGYSKWDNFLNVIEKAKTACENAGAELSDHFADVGKMVGIGSGSQREIQDLIWLSKKIFEEKFSKKEFAKKFKTLDFVDLNHFSGGQDQLCVRLSYMEFFEFFDILEINFAIKDFNLRLIRKGRLYVE
jgi:hypothetical protein